MKIIIFLCIILLSITSVFASNYSVAFAPNSPIKDISLKNTQLRFAVYYHAIPEGYIVVDTNENQQFSYEYNKENEDVALSLTHIKDQEQKNANCRGTTTPENPFTVLVICQNAE